MRKAKPIIARDAVEIAKAIGLSPFHGHHWELRSLLVSKIAEGVKKQQLTHAEAARRAKTSRTRITSILNRNVDDVSTDLLLRILESLGYRVTVAVTKIKEAA